MKQAIHEVIVYLKAGGEPAGHLVNEKHELNRHFEIRPMEAERLKCWECGDRFIFEVEEQKFFKEKGFAPPKRCPTCREKKWLRERMRTKAVNNEQMATIHNNIQIEETLINHNVINLRE